MAESFSAALKRYIAGGYKAPDAMRAVWHDVKVGRVARPARRRAAGRRRSPNPIHVEWTSPDQWTGKPVARKALWSRKASKKRRRSADAFIEAKRRAGETPARWYTTG